MESGRSQWPAAVPRDGHSRQRTSPIGAWPGSRLTRRTRARRLMPRQRRMRRSRRQSRGKRTRKALRHRCVAAAVAAAAVSREPVERAGQSPALLRARCRLGVQRQWERRWQRRMPLRWRLLSAWRARAHRIRTACGGLAWPQALKRTRPQVRPLQRCPGVACCCPCRCRWRCPTVGLSLARAGSSQQTARRQVPARRRRRVLRGLMPRGERPRLRRKKAGPRVGLPRSKGPASSAVTPLLLSPRPVGRGREGEPVRTRVRARWVHPPRFATENETTAALIRPCRCRCRCRCRRCLWRRCQCQCRAA